MLQPVLQGLITHNTKLWRGMPDVCFKHILLNSGVSRKTIIKRHDISSETPCKFELETFIF